MRTKSHLLTVAALLLALPALPHAAHASAPAPAEAHAAHVHPPDAPPGVHEPQDSPYPRPAPGRRARALGTPASAHVPVALVDFADNPSTFARADLDAMLFERGYPHGAGSFADFYAEQSGGLFTVEGTTSPWVRMPRPYAEYVGSNHGMQTGTTNAWTLVQDAVAAVDPSIDFCRADTNADGFADTFAVLHSGAGAAETGSGLWAISWSLPSPATTADVCADGEPVRVRNFIVIPERHADPSLSAPGAPRGLATIGAVVHEFGHVLGLPDLYDGTFHTPGGVGTWDVMGTGSWGFAGHTPWRPTPLSAWARIELGWARATDVREDRLEVALTSADAGHAGVFDGVYRLGDAGGEHFLIERRTRAGFAADFPRDGVLVWRIAPAGSPRRVYLVQADARDDLGRAGSSWGQGDAGDMFPGSADVRRVDDSTTPSLRFAGGGPSGFALDGIRDAGGAVSMFVTPAPDAPAPPAALQARRSRDAVALSWSASSDPGVFEYRIYRRASGGFARVATVPGATTDFTDGAAPGGALEYAVRAYNRRESADSNVAAVAAATGGGRTHAPSAVAVAVGKKVRGGAASLADADGRALEVASARRKGRHRVRYVVTVPVAGAADSFTVTGLADRRLRATVAVRRAGGGWARLGRIAASPASRFTLPAADAALIHEGSVTVRIAAARTGPFAHRVNALGVLVP